MAYNYDDELLMAFVDGTLDDPLHSEIARAVEGDPSLAKRAAALAEGDRLARALYEPLAALPVSATLRERIDALTSAPPEASPVEPSVVPFRPAARRSVGRRWLPAALAAAIALLIAGPLGFQLGRTGLPQGAPGPDGAGAVDPLMANLLSKLPSGEAFDLESGGTFTVISSFEVAEGRFCREFEVRSGTAYLGVACMADHGWRYSFLSAVDATESDGDGAFTPASSVDLLDAYLTGENAGPPLSVEEEMARLRAIEQQQDALR
ncbi:anti-sigma factor family protein [Marinivivus vitaminiproducens]|uniref:anti-sigma factor family protein n=1 Tax=Marinivivus vitaminiproducens TaxID=3035935 RepID=UPI0027A57323|nr:hypothetical protein P4R82_17355 [Geminicoccaceae bacterium SCSIO 64248]